MRKKQEMIYTQRESTIDGGIAVVDVVADIIARLNHRCLRRHKCLKELWQRPAWTTIVFIVFFLWAHDSAIGAYKDV